MRVAPVTCASSRWLASRFVSPLYYKVQKCFILLIVHIRSILLTLFFRYSVPQLMKERFSLSNIPICIEIYNPLNSGNSFPR